MFTSLVLPHERIRVRATTVLIYGPPGMGKTSLASCSVNPTLWAFDHGYVRSQYRAPAYPFSCWQEVLEILASEEEVKKRILPYNPIIIDTVGAMLDQMALHIQKLDAKLRNHRTGSLTRQGFGTLKDMYAHTFATLRSFGRDLVLVAHEKEREERGDNIRFVPAISGGSYGIVMQHVDAVGYLHQDADNKRYLQLGKNTFCESKDPAGIGRLEVPDLEKNPLLMSEFMMQIKGKLGAVSTKSLEIRAQIQEFLAKLGEAVTPEQFNSLKSELATMPKVVSIQLWQSVRQAAEQQGVILNSDKEFERAAA